MDHKKQTRYITLGIVFLILGQLSPLIFKLIELLRN